MHLIVNLDKVYDLLNKLKIIINCINDNYIYELFTSIFELKKVTWNLVEFIQKLLTHLNKGKGMSGAMLPMTDIESETKTQRTCQAFSS